MSLAHPVISQLAKRHDRSEFDCGVGSLNEYLRRQAGQDVRKNLAACFVLHDADSPVVVGYYTLSAYGIVTSELPPSHSKKLPSYPLTPATLLGRLAVDRSQAGRRYGSLLVADAIRRTIGHKTEIASYALVVEALDDSARRFYEHLDFLSFPEEQQRLFLPLSNIR